jgi:hypothetical protein
VIDGTQLLDDTAARVADAIVHGIAPEGAQVQRMLNALTALGTEWQDIVIYQGGDVNACVALADLLKIIEEQVNPILRDLHPGAVL